MPGKNDEINDGIPEGAREEGLTELHRRTQELEALLEGARAVLEGRDFATTARQIFDVARAMIGARSGYVVLLGSGGEDNDLVFLESGGLPCAVDPSVPMPLRGLRAEACAAGQTVTENDVANSVWAGLLPAGHVALQNVLFAPLTIDGETVGILGLANKPGDLTAADLRMAQAFGGLAAIALKNSRSLNALRESEQRYKLLYESAGVGIRHYAPDGVAISYNQVAATHMKGAPQDFVGRSAREIFPEPLAEEHLRRIAVACASDRPQEYEDCLEGDAATRWFLTVVTRIVDARGKVIAVQFVSNDITARKTAEEALKRSEKNLAEAQRQTHIGSFEFEFHSGRLYWSDEMYRIFAVEAEDFGGAPGDFLSRVAPEDLPRVQRIRQQGLTLARPLELEFQIVRPSGERRVVRMIFETVFDERGCPARRMGTFQDITEQRRAEQERQRLEAELQQAMKMQAVGRLAGGVAHDFNNLLTGIKGNVELALMNSSLNQEVAEHLREIGNAAETAASVTRQLLSFSRKQLIEPRVVDLNDLIRRMHKMLARLIGEDIALQTIAGSGLAMVKVDPGQIEQILINLAINARDAMPNGGKLIIETTNMDLGDGHRSQQSCLPSGPYAVLAVNDTGCGMTDDVKAHLFEPFFTTKPRGKGTGLGLATVYSVVQQAGGFIEVHSEPGRGARIRVYLPRLGARESRAQVKAEQAAMVGGNETVLVVEDEETVRSVAIKLLLRLGYTVLHANSGEEALELADRQDGPIDVLFTDVVMPGMNGRELAERLRSRHPEVRVLYASGYAEDTIAHHGLLDAGLAFIPKPYALGRLAEKLREVLENAPVPSTAPTRGVLESPTQEGR
jgi:PAS domain S-box-containing protein